MVTKQAPSPWHLCPSLYLHSGHKLSGIFQLWDLCIYHVLCWITVWLILHSSSLLSLLHCDGFLILKAGPCHLLHPDPVSFSLEPWVLDTTAWLLVIYSSNLVCSFIFSWYALKGERDPLFEGSFTFLFTSIPVHEPLVNWPLDTGNIDAHVYFLYVEIKQSWESISCSGFRRCLASLKEKMASPKMWLAGLSRFLPSLPRASEASPPFKEWHRRPESPALQLHCRSKGSLDLSGTHGSHIQKQVNPESPGNYPSESFVRQDGLGQPWTLELPEPSNLGSSS